LLSLAEKATDKEKKKKGNTFFLSSR